jgi:hypothetical protein
VTPGRSVAPGRSDEALTVRAATADDAAAISAVTRAAFAGQ